MIEDFNLRKESGHKKAQIVEWFQKHPGQRFDITEVTTAVGEELEIGQGQIRNYLRELSEDGILVQTGEKRIAYQLADDIVVPARYQARAGLRHLTTLLDYDRWGVAGFLTMTTVLWAALTLPFWFLWGTLVVFSLDEYGSISQPEFLTLAVAMSIWLIIFIFSTVVLYRIHRRYRQWRST
ncbi:hypothetical protein [Halorhabdus utahensis]|uniref:hypothetical protein n=1 Tax=Halorhabdus utahensis TaxID=146826 RepID=UPI0011804317|nr:hypothetical protein [Halorhabdus utahensis]